MKTNHKQLIFAREYRGYSQTELASHIAGLSQSNLSKYEKGFNVLSDELIQKIITFLDFPKNFFQKKISNNIESAHYRKKANITKKVKLSVEHSMRLIGYLIDQMSVSLEFPVVSIKPVDIEDGYTPEKIAKYTRKLLRLKDDEPVKDINNLLETNGIIIVEFEADTELFDGVSFVTDEGFPLIIINKHFSNDRKRFTLAHELGHLILHIMGNFLVPDYRENAKIREFEANKFASEFLMPAISIQNSLRNLRLSDLSELKRYWLVSMAAIIRRAKDLNCISADWYKYLNIELSRKGFKKVEPIPVYIDEPKLFAKAYKMHKNELEYSDEELASAFNLPIDVLKRFCSSNRDRTKLRVLA